MLTRLDNLLFGFWHAVLLILQKISPRSNFFYAKLMLFFGTSCGLLAGLTQHEVADKVLFSLLVMFCFLFYFAILVIMEHKHSQQSGDTLSYDLLKMVNYTRGIRLVLVLGLLLSLSRHYKTTPYDYTFKLYALSYCGFLYFMIDFTSPGKSLWQMAKTKLKRLANKSKQSIPALV